jgi:hypothetical protein
MGKRQLNDADSRYERINGELGELKYKDLQSEVIQRGMLYEEVIHADHNSLSSYFIKAYDVPKNPKLLKEFEDRVDQALAEKGYKKDDPIRRFRKFTLDEQEPEVPIVKIPKPPKEIKAPRVKDKQFNIYTGTKKQLTYELTKDLFDKLGKKYKNNAKELCKKFSDKLLTRVLAKFPEAQDKSVKIWMARCMKALCEKKEYS